MTLGESKELDQHDFEDFELVQGTAPDIFGLKLTDQVSGSVSVWWTTDKVIAKLHGRVHWTLNLDNNDLDERAGIYP